MAGQTLYTEVLLELWVTQSQGPQRTRWGPTAWRADPDFGEGAANNSLVSLSISLLLLCTAVRRQKVFLTNRTKRVLKNLWVGETA